MKPEPAETPEKRNDPAEGQLLHVARNAYEVGDLYLARKILNKLNLDDPQTKALQVSVDAGLHDWDNVEKTLKHLSKHTPETKNWALSNVFDEVSGLLDRRFYDHAQRAVKAVPKSSLLEKDQAYTLARVYYEVGDKHKSLELIEKLDLKKPEHVSLLAALYIGLHDWHALNEVFQSWYILNASSEWVLMRLAGEINTLIDKHDLSNAMQAIQIVPSEYVTSEKLKYAFARAYFESAVISHYETGFISKAQEYVDDLENTDRHAVALKLAIHSGLRQWKAFESLLEESKLGWTELRWVYLHVLSQMSHMVDRGEFSDAYDAFNLIPKEFPVPAGAVLI